MHLKRYLDPKDEADMLEVYGEFLRDSEGEVIRNIEMTNNDIKNKE